MIKQNDYLQDKNECETENIFFHNVLSAVSVNKEGIGSHNTDIVAKILMNIFITLFINILYEYYSYYFYPFKKFDLKIIIMICAKCDQSYKLTNV